MNYYQVAHKGFRLFVICWLIAFAFPVRAEPEKLTQVGASELVDYRWIHVASEFWWITGLPDGHAIELSAHYNPYYWETYFPYVLVRFPYAGQNQMTTYTRYPSDYPLKVRWIFYGIYGDVCYHNYEPMPRHDTRRSITVPSCLPGNQPFYYAAFQTLPGEDAPNPNSIYIDAITITVDIPSCDETPGCKPRAWLPVVVR